MTSRSAPRTAESFGSRADFERWHARRRWARADLTYLAMLIFAVIFVGPLLFAAVSSVKVNPLEYPPSFNIPQLSPKNWAAAARLGVAGNDDRWFGGFSPGARVPFRVTYFVPEGQAAEAPELEISRRRPGGLGSAQKIDFAADYAKLTPLRETSSTPATFPVRGEETAGQFVTYAFTVSYPGEGPETASLPLDLTAPVGQLFVESTLAPSLLERRGRVASYDNATPGAIGYALRNYVRVFTEVKSVTTGQPLFSAWLRNSTLISLVRVLTTLLFVSMAGYALARIKFPGRTLIFFHHPI